MDQFEKNLFWKKKTIYKNSLYLQIFTWLFIILEVFFKIIFSSLILSLLKNYYRKSCTVHSDSQQKNEEKIYFNEIINFLGWF